MLLKQDKCSSCGASIDYSKVQQGVYRCPYCRHYYNINEKGIIDEYKVKLSWMGKDVYCYLSAITCENGCPDTYRDVNGKLSYIRNEPTLKFELISYKIEEPKNQIISL